MGFGVWGFLWPPAVEGWPGSLADLVMVADGGREGGKDAAVVVDSCRAGKEVGALWPEQLAPAMVEGGGAGAGRAEGEEAGEWDAWCAGWGR